MVATALKEGGKATGAVVIGATAVKGGITAIGFSSAGPVAGSIAAGIQSGIGNVVAGSAFATAQSFGMATIIGLSAPIAVGAGVGAGVYGLGKVFKWWWATPEILNRLKLRLCI